MKTTSKTPKSLATPTHNSVTKVNFPEYVKTTYYNGIRKTIGFKGDKGLYARFKPVSKQLYGTTCRAFESFMAATLAAVEHKVNFSLTGEPINIEHIIIERNLRPRRKLEIAETNVDVTTCFVENCDLPGTVEGEWVETNGRFMACPGHVRSIWLKDKRWKVF